MLSVVPPLDRLSLNKLFHNAVSIDAHYGANSDASVPIQLIALSRLARTKDVDTMQRMASGALGTALLASLRNAIVKVAVATGFSPELSAANVVTIFNLFGSSTKYKSQYGDFGSLQSHLP